MNIYESLLAKAINSGGSDVLATYTYTGTLAQLTPLTATEIQNVLYDGHGFVWDDVFRGEVDIWIYAKGSAVGMDDLVFSPLPIVYYSDNRFEPLITNSYLGAATFADDGGNYIGLLGVVVNNDIPTQIHYLTASGGEVWLADGTKVDLLQYASQIPTVTQITVRRPAPSSANRIQTITGTLDNPFGEVSVSELSNAIKNNDASALIVADLTALGGIDGLELYSLKASNNGTYDYVIFGNTSLSNTPCYAVEFIAFTDGNRYAWYWDGSDISDMSAYLNAIPCTLTICWHPMS